MRSVDTILHTSHILLAGERQWTDTIQTTLEANFETAVARRQSTTTVLDYIRSEPVDCLITGYHLCTGSSLELIEEIRKHDQTVPIVLCTPNGSETIADDALAAGATDYISLPDECEVSVDEILERIARTVRTNRRMQTQRDRARQFEAIFQHSDTATWVLDRDGRVKRANEPARDMNDESIDALVDEPFWELPCWTTSRINTTPPSRGDLEQYIDAATKQTVTTRITTETSDDGKVVELAAHPVTNPSGRLDSVVVTGSDISERVSLHRELRESEELHRVTLNNMTDTILVTNEAGEFTYICPNVYYIFGYSVEEIRELGTIDALLGEGLFDREELAEVGMLRNIECKAIDKAGEEHTLLVNVREVDIQDGTILFSCRDITKRKQREEALSTLHGTTRNLLYAESKTEIAQQLAEDSSDVLDIDGTAIYLYDSGDNHLRPTAYSPSMEKLHGPIQPVSTTEDTVLANCFVNDEVQWFDDIRQATLPGNPQTRLRSAIIIPLGDHGIFLAGSEQIGVFDAIKREIADLAAATAEAALDRITREETLRSQDRQLQRKNQRLTAVNEINDLIREIDRTLVQAETREEVNHSVCDALTQKSNFAFAWIGEFDPSTEALEPIAWAGDEQGYLDVVDLRSAESTEPARKTASTGTIRTVTRVAEGIREHNWQKHALAAGFQSVISIPIAYDTFQYGVLTVYADTPDAFSSLAQDVLAELGETIALAMSALNRKTALLTSGGTQLEFETSDTTFPPLQLATQAACSLTFQSGVGNGDGNVSMFVSAESGEVETVRRAAEELHAIESVHILNDTDAGGLLGLRFSSPVLAISLADHGAILKQIDTTPEQATITVETPTSIDTGPVVRHVRERLESAELIAKRSDTETSLHQPATILEELTDRQLEVLQTAYYSGYFESPRKKTGEDIAAMLDISPPAFYKHTRTVERKLFTLLFEDLSLPTTE